MANGSVSRPGRGVFRKSLWCSKIEISKKQKEKLSPFSGGGGGQYGILHDTGRLSF
jgi:hypothetical protein